MKPRFFPGQTVLHVHSGVNFNFGPGVILTEWGSWFACRTCYVEIQREERQCSLCRSRRLTGPDGFSTEPLCVSGKGTFDILFSDGKTRPVNAKWLIAG